MLYLSKKLEIQNSEQGSFVQDGENKYYVKTFYYLRAEHFVDLIKNDTALCDITVFKNELLNHCGFAFPIS